MVKGQLARNTLTPDWIMDKKAPILTQKKQHIFSQMKAELVSHKTWFDEKNII